MSATRMLRHALRLAHACREAAASGAQQAPRCLSALEPLLCAQPNSWQCSSSSSGSSGSRAAAARQELLQPRHGYAAHYAKGRGKKSGKNKPAEADEDDEAAAAEADDPGFDPEPVERLMQQAVQHFEQELAGVRTGRAHPGLIENLLVDASGDHVPLKACGSVTVRNPQQLAVVLFDPALAKPVELAIRNSPLSLSPTAEGSEVLVGLPRMTQDTIDRMVKLVHMEAEGAHTSIRRARQKGMDAAKKAVKAADERKRAEKEVQKLYDQYMAEVEHLKKAKDTELREHRD